ncbi:MAG: CopG family transcriptional regulator, partial [Casimicrobiaceae bacterium]
FDKLERDQNILIETLALYVRYYLSISTPLPAAHQDAARAQGKARFEQFVQQLARHLQRGNSLVREVHEEVYPEDRKLFEHANVDADQAAGEPT